MVVYLNESLKDLFVSKEEKAARARRAAMKAKLQADREKEARHAKFDRIIRDTDFLGQEKARQQAKAADEQARNKAKEEANRNTRSSFNQQQAKKAAPKFTKIDSDAVKDLSDQNKEHLKYYTAKFGADAANEYMSAVKNGDNQKTAFRKVVKKFHSDNNVHEACLIILEALKYLSE